MAASSSTVMGYVTTLFSQGTLAGVSDGDLLDRFLARSQESPRADAEVVFSVLLARHDRYRVRLTSGCRGYRMCPGLGASRPNRLRFRDQGRVSWLVPVRRSNAACRSRSGWNESQFRLGIPNAKAASAVETRRVWSPTRCQARQARSSSRTSAS